MGTSDKNTPLQKPITLYVSYRDAQFIKNLHATTYERIKTKLRAELLIMIKDLRKERDD